MELRMDVQALRCFVAVARHRNFTRAGQALHLSQPAVSKTIKALEEELGTTLLLRERLGLSPEVELRSLAELPAALGLQAG